jgi:rhodanese-related sulfurtransferase
MPGTISPETLRHAGISNYYGTKCHCEPCPEQSEGTQVEAIPSKYSPARWILSLVILTCLTLTNCQYSKDTKPELPKHKQTVLGLYVTAKEAYEKWRADPEKVKILDVRTPEEYIFVGHAEMAWNIPLAFQTYDWDSTKQHFAIEPNPEFVSHVKEQFTVEDTLLVICRSGGRSAMAVNFLAKAGFKNAFNIIEGMEGDLVKHLEGVDGDNPSPSGQVADKVILVIDPLMAQLRPEAGAGDSVSGGPHHVYASRDVFREKRLKNGWKNSGLPWTYKINPGKMKLPMESN